MTNQDATQEAVDYCKPSECLKIQWGKLHLRNGVPACPSCGEPAEQIISFFGLPGWAHEIERAQKEGGDE